MQKRSSEGLDWVSAVPGLLFSRPLNDPWCLDSPQGRLLSRFNCSASDLGRFMRDLVSPPEREELERLYARGEDYTLSYTCGSLVLHESATRVDSCFVCMVTEFRESSRVAQLALLAQTIPEPASLIDQQHRYACVNQAWRRIFQESVGDPQGRALAEVWGQDLYDTRLKPMLAQAFAGQQLTDEFWSDLGAMGSRCRSLSFYPCAPRAGRIEEVVLVTRDITDLKVARQALDDSIRSASQLRDRAALSLQVAQIGIWSLDFDSLTVNWDQAMHQIYGQPPGVPVTLERWRELIHPEDRHHMKGFLEAQTTGMERQIAHYRVIRPDGDVRFVKAIFGLALEEDGSASGLVGASVDVTELHEIQEALRRASRAAEDASQAKSRFLATMSHEIRTPMNAILGLVHLVRLTELNPRQDDYLRKLERAARSLLDIINDILDFSKVEAGKLALETVDFRLGEVLDNLGQLLQVRARDKPGLEILFSVDPETPDALRGDPLRLGQILLNLGGNAVKFTERGEVVIAVRCLERLSNGWVLEFAVTDTGIGLQPEHLPALFQPFSQADSSTARKYGGTGLGLSISQQLVDLMGGHIWAGQNPSGGARFVFTARFEAAQSASATRERRLTDEHAELRVLIVDDNPSARGILALMVQGFGFQTDLAESGEAAVELAAQRSYDVILMDWRLTGIDGIEASRRIRGLAQDRRPIILLVTAYDGAELTGQLGQAALDGLLYKPLTESNLYDAIATALHRRETGEAGARGPENRNSGASSRYQARVLLVEDNDINRQVAGEMLSLRGIEVSYAASAEEAWALLERQSFELIFMDVQMPGIDGLEATRKIRIDPNLRQVPIVAVTANAMMGDRERCLQAGMTDYLSKPIEPGALQEILERYLTSASLTVPSFGGETGSSETLDTRSALDRLGGNTPLYLKLLSQFQEKYVDSVTTLTQALASGEWEVARGIAHTLKGSAANLGMTRVAEQARSLEQALQAGFPQSEGLLVALQRELDQVVPAILELQEAPVSSEPEASSPRGNDALLREIDALLRVDIGRALTLSQNLMAQYADHAHAAGYRELNTLLHEFSIEEAEEVLRGLLGSAEERKNV